MGDQAPTGGHPTGQSGPACLPGAIAEYTAAVRGVLARLNHYTDAGEADIAALLALLSATRKLRAATRSEAMECRCSEPPPPDQGTWLARVEAAAERWASRTHDIDLEEWRNVHKRG